MIKVTDKPDLVLRNSSALGTAAVVAISAAFSALFGYLILRCLLNPKVKLAEIDPWWAFPSFIVGMFVMVSGAIFLTRGYCLFFPEHLVAGIVFRKWLLFCGQTIRYADIVNVESCSVLYRPWWIDVYGESRRVNIQGVGKSRMRQILKELRKRVDLSKFDPDEAREIVQGQE
jgi:hypothetical protein